jgi:hypothetical protein
MSCSHASLETSWLLLLAIEEVDVDMPAEKHIVEILFVVA